MYTVAIADDEIKIREGLRDLVDWNGLGFELIGAFDDGTGLLELITSRHVDLVVTDIKMNLRSGLDVSEYLFQHRPQTRVVLISGYKEAELAMSAIKFGVKDYILKPIDLDELTACLSRMREELNNERDANNRQQKLTQALSDMSGMKELFFEELLMGSLDNQSYIQRMFELLYPDLSFNRSACFSLTLQIQQYENFIREEWLHSRSELHGYIVNFVSIVAIDTEFQLISKQNERLLLFGLLHTVSENPVSKTIERDVHTLCTELSTIFGLKVQVGNLEIWSSIPVMLRSREVMTEGNFTQMMEQFGEQQRILYSILREGMQEDISLGVEKYVTLLCRMSLPSAQDTVRNFLYTVSAKLREDGLTPAAALALEGAFLNIDTANTHTKLATMLGEAFKALAMALKNEQQEMVQRAKDYIVQHIGDDISLEDIADRFYLSQYHFSRTFKAKTGETVISFIIRCKIEHAMKLLQETHLKIYEICEKVGYHSLRHFTKLFKSHTGMTPSGYRQWAHMEGGNYEEE